ncbi:MAG: RdgB/HAM1 family non-canonical purine NTP pyrophosphatase [Zetaproteobacteria bacterium]|nr:MAG: RdgB/HAM1 family non-canonical purine NTP pyrophosphatase [Zetaproteobacteria bacterium]
MIVVFASTNPHKREEAAAILAPYGIKFVPLENTKPVKVVEDGRSFRENAEKKARAWAEAHGLPALADDSGLCVEALGGAPGVFSARFAGAHATDADNNAKLLRLMEGVTNRRARFVCAVCLAWPDGRVLHAEGHVEGEILPAPRGTQGFGYDPLFFCPELGCTFAEASPEMKNRVSHRRRALVALAAKLAERAR